MLCQMYQVGAREVRLEGPILAGRLDDASRVVRRHESREVRRLDVLDVLRVYLFAREVRREAREADVRQ